MPVVIDNNEPRYIEDFRRPQPDWANGEDPNGDPDPEVDWLPAFKRAAYEHLDTRPSEPLRFQRTYQRPILLGRNRGEYRLSGTLHLFGIHLEGLYPGVELRFDQGTDGLHIHYPHTRSGPGTSSGLPAPVTDYGGSCTLRNLLIRGTGAEGTRGIIVQRASLLDTIGVFRFGWHGFHVTADVKRDTGDIDGAISNANGTTLIDCRAHDCGHSPGTDRRLVSAANPDGHRPFGSGLRLQGGDANICYTRSFNGSSCARWAIDDVGFLGNRHVLPHCVNCYHEVPSWEAEIGSHADASQVEKRDYRTYEVAVGDRLQLAYHVENRNARTILASPYVESAQTTPIVDVQPPSFVIGGIGGSDRVETRRIRSGRLTNLWRFVTDGPYGTPDETWISEGNGVFLTLAAKADHPTHPYRLKYLHFENDDPRLAEQSHRWAGFFRLDRGNLNSQMALALTGARSHEKTRRGGLGRQLDPGRLVMLSHYRAANFTHLRKVEYGVASDLPSIESAFPAADREVGDAYTCLRPIAGGVYTAVVIEDPDDPGTRFWAKVSEVER